VDGDSITTSSFTQDADNTNQCFDQRTSLGNMLTSDWKQGRSQSIDGDWDSDDSPLHDFVKKASKSPRSTANHTPKTSWDDSSLANHNGRPRFSSANNKLGAVPNRYSIGGAPRLSFTKVPRGGFRI
jgi:hypothetical protein